MLKLAPNIKTCTWHQDDSWWDGGGTLLVTDCGKDFVLEEPEHGDLNYCCYCGRVLAMELIEPEE